MPASVTPLLAIGVAVVLVIVLFALLGNNNSLNGIKSKTVGDGQHGTARWATAQEVRKTYVRVPFDVTAWRKGENRPTVQGMILGSIQRGKQVDALVDCDDVHCLMIGASGVGKTAFFLYPNLEFACASGMSFLALDTKGDLARNYGMIAQKYYGYRVSVVDLRNPTRSDGNNLLTLINRYMDLAKEQPDNLAARAKAEKYAKILAKTIVNPGGDEQDRGQNAYFYDAAEGLLTSVILLLAEYVPPDAAGHERRHIVSVFKLVQELLAPVGNTKKNGFQVLLNRTYNGKIDNTLNTITVSGVDDSALTSTRFAPDIEISSDTKICSPASGITQDFSEPVTYIVNGDSDTVISRTYTVSVLNQSGKLISAGGSSSGGSSGGSTTPTLTGAKITNFKIYGVEGEIDHTAGTIVISLPNGTNVTKVLPQITTVSGCTVSPADGQVVNLTRPVKYTVTKGEETKVYTVSVKYVRSISQQLWDEVADNNTVSGGGDHQVSYDPHPLH